MKLLFDENLSPKLVRLLGQEFPDSTHIENIDLRGSPDQRIWNYARTNGLAIVSKDTDFRERSALEGFPPKVIWLDVGNAGTADIANLLQREQANLATFEADSESSMFVLSSM